MSDIAVSFEFFPPRTLDAEGMFWSTLARLDRYDPSFVSVTYGAGGSSREATTDVLARAAKKTSIEMAGHLTCVGQTKAETNAVIEEYWDKGVQRIVALRGDMPEPGTAYAPHPAGYQHTPELVRAIKEIAPFDVSVSAYPETHPDSPSLEHDLRLLSQKADAGADRAITQFCFDTEKIVALRDAADALGISIPIVPGILPVTNFAGTSRIAGRCGASIPESLARRYSGTENDPETARMLAAIVAAEQVEFLRREGFEQFHLYTLNRPEIAVALCHSLGAQPVEAA